MLTFWLESTNGDDSVYVYLPEGKDTDRGTVIWDARKGDARVCKAAAKEQAIRARTCWLARACKKRVPGGCSGTRFAFGERLDGSIRWVEKTAAALEMAVDAAAPRRAREVSGAPMET